MVEEAHVHVQAQAKDVSNLSHDRFNYSSITIGERLMWLVWIVMAIIVAMIADSKGRSSGWWFFYGLLLWPIALVHILLKESLKAARPISAADKIARLAELERLKENEAISEQEYMGLRSEMQSHVENRSQEKRPRTTLKILLVILAVVVIGPSIVGKVLSNREATKAARPATEESQAYIKKLRKEGRISESSGGSITIKASAEAPPATLDNWSYFSNADDMTSKPIRFAQVTSNNQISLDSPYQGAQRGTLELRTHPRYGKDVILSIDRGQFLCHTYDCSVMVRFDDKSPVRYEAGEPSDYSTTTLFIRNYSRFVEQLKQAKKVRIEVKLFHNGTQTFEFDVAGFSPDKYLSKP